MSDLSNGDTGDDLAWPQSPQVTPILTLWLFLYLDRLKLTLQILTQVGHVKCWPLDENKPQRTQGKPGDTYVVFAKLL